MGLQSVVTSDSVPCSTRKRNSDPGPGQATLDKRRLG